MPTPGMRDQFRDHTVRNPDGEQMRKFHSVPYHGIPWAGRSPALMERTLRGCVLAAGQIRRMWRQSVNYVAAQSPISWTDNAPQPGRPEFVPVHGVGITRALRYMTRSVYGGAGQDNTRLSEMHTVVQPRVRSKPVSVGVGQKRSQPTIRNRLTSFGSRVPPLNPRMNAAMRSGAEEKSASEGGG